MKKPTTLPFPWGERLLLFVVAAIFALFFSNDFGLIDIQKTAIIVAVGVDKTESGEVSISAQIASPQPSNTGAQTAAIVVTGEGETVAEAFKEINIRTGWFPKLVFCEVIVLGEEVVEEDVFSVLGYFLRDEYMSDNCLLATCEGKAEDILSAKTPTDELSALALDKILSAETRHSGNVSTVNLKDFAVGYYSKHKSSYMPRIEREKSDEDAVSTGTGGAEEGKGSGGEKKDLFVASKTALFFGGKQVAILSEDESFALNLVSGKIRQATVSVPTDSGVYALNLTRVSSGIEFRADGGKPEVRVELSATASVLDRRFPSGIAETSDKSEVKEEVLRAAEKKLKEEIERVFRKGKEVGCDVFRALDKMQRFAPEKCAEHEKGVLDNLVCHVSVKIKRQ